MLDLLGRYEVVGRIAVGGTGEDELWLGREPAGRPVAIKRIPRGIGRGSLARHPNLVEVIEILQIEEEYFLVMEYLEGENLAGLIRRLIKRRERIAYGLAAHMIAEVCDGLHAAHLAGELHRAVNPENVFITYGGDVKLLDLGVAAVDPESLYRSPEQAGSRPLGRQSDVYSTGLVLYELTTLRRLFARVEDTEQRVPLPSSLVPDYPSDLEAVCMRAIARNAAERYRSALELRDALLEVARVLEVDHDPTQALASKLMRLFGDRIATKRDLLDKLRAGVELGDLVPTEADEEIEVPLARSEDRIEDDVRTDPKQRPSAQMAAPPSTPSSRMGVVNPTVLGTGAPLVQLGDNPPSTRASAPPIRASAPLPLPAPRPTPMPDAPDPAAKVDDETRTTPLKAKAPHAAAGFRWGVALLFMVASAGGGAAGAWLRLREEESSTAPPPKPAAKVDAGVRDGALPDFVTISIDTEPGNAKVLVDGEERGVTPVDLRVPGGVKPIAVELRRDGYRPLTRDLVPDQDRTLHEKLVR